MSVLNTKLPLLRLLANQAMWTAWHAAGLHRGTPNEVACIKNLIQIALPQVEAAWRPALKKVGMTAQLYGVVCHGHPWVRYSGAPSRCELGDFLLVHDHRLVNGPLRRRAAIVQAKVFHVGGVRAKNSVQLNLYKRWPRFTYDSWPGGINNLDHILANAGLHGPNLRERELTITDLGKLPASSVMLDDGCRYGMIDVKHSRWGNPQTGMNPWRLCSAQAYNVYTSQAGLTLGSYLVRLMGGRVGRNVPFTQWPASLSVACHWSLMVMELLSILQAAPTSSISRISFRAATPNLNLNTGGALGPTPMDQVKMEEGAFGVIQVQTFGDIG